MGPKFGSAVHWAGRAMRAWCIALVLLVIGWSGAALAQDQSTLLTLLRDGSSFRVRARAALALARTGDERAVSGLEAALRDVHVTVRSAAATALGRIGSRRSVPALRAAASDPSPQVSEQAKSALQAIAAREAIARALPARVRSSPRAARPSLARVRYAVVLGEMRNRSAIGDPDVARWLAERIGDELRKLPRMAVFALDDMNEAVAHELARRKIPTFRIEGNLSRAETVVAGGEHKVRCEVSLLLLDEPERTLRSQMKGAASVSAAPRGPRDVQARELVRRTLAGAVHSATASAAQAIEAAAVRRHVGTGDIRAEASLAPKPRRK